MASYTKILKIEQLLRIEPKKSQKVHVLNFLIQEREKKEKEIISVNINMSIRTLRTMRKEAKKRIKKGQNTRF